MVDSCVARWCHIFYVSSPATPATVTAQNAIIALKPKWLVECPVLPFGLSIGQPPHTLLLFNIMFNHYAWLADETQSCHSSNNNNSHQSNNKIWEQCGSSLDGSQQDWLTHGQQERLTDWQTDWLSWMRLHSLSKVGVEVSFQFRFVVLYIINGFHMPGYFESITGTCYNYKQLLIVPARIESNVVAMA